VATGNEKLFNHAAQVVLVREGDHTVLTMASDYRGDPQRFALVVPVPVVLTREQVRVADAAAIDALDAWSAPRLVEYPDPEPCPRPAAQELHFRGGRGGEVKFQLEGIEATQLRGAVRIEAQYKVDEYDVTILQADNEQALLTWMKANHYNVPPSAAPTLRSYLRQGMHFFLARVDLGKQARLGFHRLRPLQVAYDSPRFMLPVRLGMVNAAGPQELVVYAFSREGRVEAANYRNARLPEALEVPDFIRGDFTRFERDLFARAAQREGLGVVFTEHFWPITWCDPCASRSLTLDELRGLGVSDTPAGGNAAPGAPVYITRLHAKYDRASFPEDLVLQATSDHTPWQSRAILRPEWRGDCGCEQGRHYVASLPARRQSQALALANSAGWNLAATRARMGVDDTWRRRDEPHPDRWDMRWPK
jgi:hypothetical protein